MNARDDENYYRGLLESAQKGIENAKAFLETLTTRMQMCARLALTDLSGG